MLTANSFPCGDYSGSLGELPSRSDRIMAFTTRTRKQKAAMQLIKNPATGKLSVNSPTNSLSPT
jgi:hypothetical protein